MKAKLLACTLIFAFGIGISNACPTYKPRKKVTTASPLSNLRTLAEINEDEIYDSGYFLSEDGLRLYYISDDNKLQMVERKRVSAKFNEPKTIQINTQESIESFWFSEDELQIYFTTWGDEIFTDSRASTTADFTLPQEIKLTGISDEPSFYSISLSPDANELFLLMEDEEVDIHLTRFTKAGGNNYKLANKVDLPENLLIETGQLSKDGLKFYASIDDEETYNIYVLSREELNKPFTQMEKLDFGETHADNEYPSVSGDDRFLIMESFCDDENHDYDLHIVNLNSVQRIQVPIKSTWENTVVQDVETEQFNIYPNPVKDVLNVNYKLTENTNNAEILIYTISGQLIKKVNIENSFGIQEIPVIELPSGTYFCRVQLKDAILPLQKFVVVK